MNVPSPSALVATTTSDGKLHVALDGNSTYFYNFREDAFSALDFWCKDRQSEAAAYLCGAMATEGRMVCFEIKIEGRKIDAIREVGYRGLYLSSSLGAATLPAPELCLSRILALLACLVEQKERERLIRRSKDPLQRGVVAELVASRAPWVVTRSEGDDTEVGDVQRRLSPSLLRQAAVQSLCPPKLRIHSYEGDLLTCVDTKQVRNLQLAVSGDGCFFGCAAWTPGVKIFEVKTKGGNFQKVEKAMDIRSDCGLLAFGISLDRTMAAVVDKGGCLSSWRINVRHQAQEDPKKICETALQLDPNGLTTLHFSRDGSVLVVATGKTLYFLRSADLEVYKIVEHITVQPIEHLLIAPNNKFVLLCAVRPNPHNPLAPRDIAERKQTASLPRFQKPSAVAFSPNSNSHSRGLRLLPSEGDSAGSSALTISKSVKRGLLVRDEEKGHREAFLPDPCRSAFSRACATDRLRGSPARGSL
ncbi:transducin -like related protein [Cyclospora cayetanensis]|uniref:Transducin-like related protein n=1 Tax=Cyclospora cayetanensis TaxID=88456 RepID=A0A1D3D0X0_9EIME|nr:transducin -like related protein [Cyclospora cayetanensis]